mmetsp:Transcript_57261/g.95151  ORF Transcript_57261/g.95151 Transcript_57261/m.95151 type:complete len:210 (+) Transcript_57261:128-757(+)
MEGFLGTTIQYAERELLRLEQEHAIQMERTAEELIAAGFLESDYEEESSDGYDSDNDSDVVVSDVDEDVGDAHQSRNQACENDQADDSFVESTSNVIDANDKMDTQPSNIARDVELKSGTDFDSEVTDTDRDDSVEIKHNDVLWCAVSISYRELDFELEDDVTTFVEDEASFSDANDLLLITNFVFQSFHETDEKKTTNLNSENNEKRF